jgi:Fic family protein
MPLETPARIEPCLLETLPSDLVDVIAELSSAASTLAARLHPTSAASLAGLVRVMNCYYSNLIEGHNTRPRDIERALSNDLDRNEKRRELQLEARAHVLVQRQVDALCQAGSYGEAASVERILWLHREFYRDAPANLLNIKHHEGDYAMVPGELRQEPRHDVMVGRHLPPSSSRVLDFMTYFEQCYRFERLGRSARIIAMAAAHHRLNYIHPFVDGNGRVSRLMSHAMAQQAGIGAHGLWSISRGLARGFSDAGEYKRMMDEADSPRRGDLDGRGNLSLEALVSFVTWFCKVALDQVRFMGTLFDLETLEERLSRYVQTTLGFQEEVAAIALEALRRGEMPRGDAARVTGKSERTARGMLGALLEAGLLESDSAKTPVRLRFALESADVLFPRLFPAQAGAAG